MFEDRIREICQALGYAPVEFLWNTKGTAVASVHALAADRAAAVARLTAATRGEAPPAALWASGGYLAGAVNVARPGSRATMDPGRDEQALQEMALRWEIGVMAGGKPVNPVLEFGVMRKHLYQVRPYYPTTLHHLIERQLIPGHALLFRVVDQLWAALAFLHHLNQPHGALTASNVGFSTPPLG